MATITDLTNTTWYIPAGWSATAGCGIFNVNYSKYEEGFNSTDDFIVLGIGHGKNGSAYDDLIQMVSESSGNYGVNNSRTFTLTFTGGTDVTNPSLISWLDANGECQNPPVTTVTIEYNGETIANIEGGQTATLNCAGKKMSTDISITAPEIAEANLQEKTITENGEVTPDEGYDGFSKVNVNVPIPDGYIDPEGNKEITENGTHDISEFESVTINIPIPVVEVYDGMVTYVGNVNLINFTIEGIEYQAEEGMTWEEWVDSEYNTENYLVDAGGGIINNGDYSKYVADASGNFVNTAGDNSDDVIIGGHAYSMKLNGNPA